MEILNDPDICAVLEHGMDERDYKRLKKLVAREKATAGLNIFEKAAYGRRRGWWFTPQDLIKAGEEMSELGKKAIQVLEKFEQQSFGTPPDEQENLY